MADDQSADLVLPELRALLKRSRQQEVQLLDALTRVLSLIERDQSP